MPCCRYAEPGLTMLGSADRAVALINANLKIMPGVTSARLATRVEEASVCVTTDAGLILLALVSSGAGNSARKIPYVVVSNDTLVYVRRLALAIRDNRKALTTRDNTST